MLTVLGRISVTNIQICMLLRAVSLRYSLYWFVTTISMLGNIWTLQLLLLRQSRVPFGNENVCGSGISCMTAKD